MRLETLQVARLSPKLLSEARDLVADYVRSQFRLDPATGEGAFINRAEKPDLYYTVFGIDCLLALREDLPRGALLKYAESFGEGEGLDLVHLGCLARLWAAMDVTPTNVKGSILTRIEAYRSGDGGYSQSKKATHGSNYACFVALGAHQDLKSEISHPQGLITCIASQRTRDGAYSNGPDLPLGTTPTTAAALTMLRVLQQPHDRAAGDWLLAQQHPQGGFLAVPDAPMPDLLSTAVALHALSGIHVEIAPIRDKTLDFLDSLWVNRGSFFGTWSEDTLDVEYTYYALLALGHLSL
ncbi:MAG: prenyltransferase/squalene oxidase repeat-containing protein [Phycisphaeraceae bacterium]